MIINSHGRSGGCVMLSLLCKLLADRGYDARLMIFPYIDPINQFSKIIVWRDWLRYHLYNWMRNKKESVKNPDLWKELYALCEKHKVTYNWVKGHAGHPENERCDTLAVNFYQQYL